MTLAAAVVPLAAYAVAFQTILYFSLPSRLRTMWAPVVTGIIGAALTVAAGVLFGFETVGFGVLNPASVAIWGLAAIALTSIVAGTMLIRPDLRVELADPRLAELSPRQVFIRIFVRIPVFTALIEEAFFRGVLHAALIALYPAETAIWVGAGLFGMWHIGPGVDQARAGDKSWPAGAVHTAATVVATTLAGAFLVWLRIETGSIWAPVAVHAAVNVTMAIFARTAARMSQTLPGTRRPLHHSSR